MDSVAPGFIEHDGPARWCQVLLKTTWSASYILAGCNADDMLAGIQDAESVRLANGFCFDSLRGRMPEGAKNTP